MSKKKNTYKPLYIELYRNLVGITKVFLFLLPPDGTNLPSKKMDFKCLVFVLTWNTAFIEK